MQEGQKCKTWQNSSLPIDNSKEDLAKVGTIMEEIFYQVMMQKKT